MPTQIILGCVPFVAILATVIVIALANRKQRSGATPGAWQRSGWTIVHQDASSLLGRASMVSTRVHRGLVLEFVSEFPPRSAAPFHEVMGTRFASKWRSYLRVDLGSRPSCSFQIFERAALVKRPFWGLAPAGAVWSPRWRNGLSSGEPRLDSRFELYGEDPARASSLARALAAPLLAAPAIGLLEVVDSELRVYVSTIAAGLTGDAGAGLAAHLDRLSELVVDAAHILESGSSPSGTLNAHTAP